MRFILNFGKLDVAMTLIEETVLAARGVLALVLGRRNASIYFDLGLRGLVGSSIAFLIALAINAYLPSLAGLGDAGNAAVWPGVFMVFVLLVTQIIFSAIVLRQFGRLDGLVPYLVTDNWTTLLVTVLTIVLGLFGMQAELILILVGVLVLVVKINTARLIVTLSGWQIAAFLVAQLIGVFVGLMIIGLFFPIPEPVSIQ